MLNTYHVSAELSSKKLYLSDEVDDVADAVLYAVIVFPANQVEEASDRVAKFFENHGITANVVHAWEVA